ncbi:MAG: hypothetical protein H7308_09995 [Chthonomonadaceae bacterium]|nr:hypothetical protein [Chthonomonadaceae bacterium]
MESPNQRIISILRANGVKTELPCPRCNADGFVHFEGYYALPHFSDVECKQPTGDSLSCIVTACRRCGHLSYYASHLLNPTPSQEE